MSTQRMQQAVQNAKGYHKQVLLFKRTASNGLMQELRAHRAYWLSIARQLCAEGVQQVSAQPVYTLELAVGEDVAHKEYHDYTRAKQAYDDAVADELALTLTGVTRIELFSEAVGSMDKWVRGEPALASPAEPVPPAGGEPVIYALSRYNDSGGFSPSMVPRETLPEPETREGYVAEADHRTHVTRLQAEVDKATRAKKVWSEMATSREKERDALKDELTKARERITALETTGRAFAKAAAQGADSGDWGSWAAWEWDELVAFQAVLDDKDAQL